MGLHPSSLSKCSNLWELSRPKKFVFDIYNWHIPLSLLDTCDCDDLLDLCFCSSIVTLSTYESFSEGQEPLASCSFQRWLTWSLTTTADPTTATVNADLREIRELVDYNCKISIWSLCQCKSLPILRTLYFSSILHARSLQLHSYSNEWSDWLTVRHIHESWHHNSSLASQALLAGVCPGSPPCESLATRD